MPHRGEAAAARAERREQHAEHTERCVALVRADLEIGPAAFAVLGVAVLLLGEPDVEDGWPEVNFIIQTFENSLNSFRTLFKGKTHC